MAATRSPGDGSLAGLLRRAREVTLPMEQSGRAARVPIPPTGRLRVGVDLGTATVVMTVLDEAGQPLAGEWQSAEVARDGLVVDFAGARELVRGMKARLERRLGCGLTRAASGFPPGVPLAEVRATAHVLEAAGLECSALVDEPSAANAVLQMRTGAIVDVGGGTTGIAILKDGRVVHSADEATGGRHFSLVVAGALGLSLEEAEALKVRPEEQARLLPLLRPVMEKVGSIIRRHTRDLDVGSITLVGGSSAFAGMREVIEEYTGIPASVPPEPLLVTPLGIAMNDPVE